jgi:hypothetical protein
VIFARRAIQRRLDELRPTLGAHVVSQLAARLERTGKDRLAAMWEVVTLHGLSSLGTLQHEVRLETGRKPDIYFETDNISITADVTTVSDEGLHEQNPANTLSELIHREQGRLGLPVGGVHLQIDSREKHTRRGYRIELCLPERRRLPELVRNKIVPVLKEQVGNGAQVFSVSVKDGTTSLRVIIDPKKAPYSSTSYSSYDIPFIRDNNPLYKALKGKAKQLREASGLVGIIVGDSSSRTFDKTPIGAGHVSSGTIAAEFLRQHSSIGFVLLISVNEEQHTWYQPGGRRKWLDAGLLFNGDAKVRARLHTLFETMLVAFPKPVRTPINASIQAKERGFGLGHHGGFTMSGNSIKVSAREVLEVLSGRCSVDEINKKGDATSRGRTSGPNTMPRLIELYLSQGRLPTQISIIKTDENDCDDWIEFEFGPPDPAITPFQ